LQASARETGTVGVAEIVSSNPGNSFILTKSVNGSLGRVEIKARTASFPIAVATVKLSKSGVTVAQT
jgi:hypothetical protein